MRLVCSTASIESGVSARGHHLVEGPAQTKSVAKPDPRRIGHRGSPGQGQFAVSSVSNLLMIARNCCSAASTASGIILKLGSRARFLCCAVIMS